MGGSIVLNKTSYFGDVHRPRRSPRHQSETRDSDAVAGPSSKFHKSEVPLQPCSPAQLSRPGAGREDPKEPMNPSTRNAMLAIEEPDTVS